MNCSSCGHENRDSAKFCEECATALARPCTRCGTQLRPSARFCDECASTGRRPVPEPVSEVARTLDEYAGVTEQTGMHVYDRELAELRALLAERVL